MKSASIRYPEAGSAGPQSMWMRLKPGLKGMQKTGNESLAGSAGCGRRRAWTKATRLTNLLLKNGTIATLEGQEFPKQVFTADPSAKPVQATAPVVVLVNRGTMTRRNCYGRYR